MRRQIKQREAAKLALNDQLEFMRALVNGTPHPIYVRDRAGLLQICNDSYLKAFSTTREAVIGKSVLNTLPLEPQRARQVHADYQQVMSKGQPMIQDRPMRINGREMTIYHWILPYRNSLGEVQGIIGGWIDISERRQLIEALHKAKDQADAANRAKSTFLATMSHEIRTPMNAVIGMLELAIQRADQGHLDRPAIEVAYGCAKDLLELIGDILDIARIESGHLVLSPERVNLGELVASVGRVFDGLARQKHLNLTLKLDPGADREVLIDPLRFKQILSNLVSNAIKFTDQGGVTLALSLAPAPDPNQLRLCIRVSDTGMGISQADQQRLFEPFAQVDGVNQGRSGAGLGLVICRSLCTLMNGTLTIDSEPGRGTEVNISMTVPSLETALVAQPCEPAPPTPDRGLNVLVIDDHPANRLLLTEQLNFLQLRHSTAANGALGLDSWLQGGFDVLIVDCNMPVMNGYELTRAVRQHEREQGLRPCTVFGYTANAQADERERCLKAGMDDCLFKPLSLVTLRQRLAQVPRLTNASRANPAVFSAIALEVLTGNDAQMQRRLLEELLRSSREDRELLCNLCRLEDMPALGDLAHKLKGAARLVEARPLEHCCEGLEWLCSQPADITQIEAQCAELERTLGELEDALKQHLRGLARAVGATARIG
ncbi:ATP-binding protein [Pseudomonas sp. R5(2019)]|uniref:ATP-binding protein n=1 Tax=Pseudomonas sp. R5(2019) TaxID=2697566 RepID=UPI00273FC1E2|nr:ATP-binding protein [Pseudomonas sp. R5(2019)]